MTWSVPVSVRLPYSALLKAAGVDSKPERRLPTPESEHEWIVRERPQVLRPPGGDAALRGRHGGPAARGDGGPATRGDRGPAAGADGGPIHTPSPISYFYFQAGVIINSISKIKNSITVQFGVNSFYDYDLEVSTNLANPDWVSIYHVVGANHSDLHFFTDAQATNSHRFYRVRETPQ